MSAGLFIARFVFGGLFAAHGSQKLFGWFGGYGLNGTAFFGAGRTPSPAAIVTSSGRESAFILRIN